MGKARNGKAPQRGDEGAWARRPAPQPQCYRRITLALAVICCAGSARAAQAVSCGGAAMAGGAEIMCSHVAPTAPAQFCTYSWTVMTTSGSPSTIEGSFLLPPGASNQAVYQGYGFNSALSNPIVLCQGRKG